jgi:glycosyltransferase involved in cell wall biosynthesis
VTIGCVVPAYNAASTLGDVLRRLRLALPNSYVVVVDDGSTDATTAVAARAGVGRVLRFDRNHGKGAALRAGFAAILDAGCGEILTIDADGQHDPTYAPRLVAGLADSDVVLGARARSGTMPLRRRVTNYLSSTAINLCVGCRLTDTQSGFRAMRADVVRRIAAAGDRYEFETDFLIRAARAGCRIGSVAIPTVYGVGRSQFRGLRDTALVVQTIWRQL